jgi:hypothetical protein
MPICIRRASNVPDDHRCCNPYIGRSHFRKCRIPRSSSVRSCTDSLDRCRRCRQCTLTDTPSRSRSDNRRSTRHLAVNRCSRRLGPPEQPEVTRGLHPPGSRMSCEVSASETSADRGAGLLPLAQVRFANRHYPLVASRCRSATSCRSVTAFLTPASCSRCSTCSMRSTRPLARTWPLGSNTVAYGLTRTR